MVDAIETRQVTLLKREITIMGDAQRHSDVRGFVALDAVSRTRYVERKCGDGEERNEEQDD